MAFASGAGNKIILFGARTGLDGIGGVSVLASDTFDAEGSRKKLPSVQVGDPFMEKVLIECCLELYAGGLVIGIQDLGGAGLSCATSELASAGDGGMTIQLDSVPLRAKEMTPAEVLCSESQERMCAVVSPKNVDAFLAVCRKWEVLATVIGEVTDGDRLQITWHGETVVDAAAHRSSRRSGISAPGRPPRYAGRAERRPLGQAVTAGHRRRAARDFACVTWQPAPVQPRVHHRAVRPLCARQHGARRARRRRHAAHRRVDRPGHRGIDRRVGTLHAAGSLRWRATRVGRGVPQRRRHRRHPGRGDQLPELRFPEDPGVMWQFTQAVRGLADGCADLGIPVTGGNVSFYNQTGSAAILPTPVVGVLGVIDDVRRRIPTGLGAEPGKR